MKYIITLLGLFTMSISSAWADETAVAKIGDTEYTDATEFEIALELLSDDATVTLLTDIDSYGLDTYWKINGDNIIFDLNGHKILGHFLIACSSMIINDSSEDKTGTIETSSDNHVIINESNLTINSGTLIGGSPFENAGTITVNGGKFEKSGYETMKIINFGQITAGEEMVFYFDDYYGYKTQIEDEDIATSYIIYTAPTAPIATIGSLYYSDASAFKDAFENFSDDATVTLLADIDLDGLGTNWVIYSDNIIFDLNGHKILGHFLIACSSMIINDSSEDKTGTIETSSDNHVIINESNLTINSGTLIGGSPFDNSRTITVNGGKFEKSGDGTMEIFNIGQITAGEGWGFLFDDGEYKTQIEDEDIATSYTIIKAPIASIGSTYYSDMATFTTDVQNLNRKADIRIFKDIDLEIEGRYLGITNGSDITLDLNGHKLKGWFDIYSSLTITDSSEGGNGSVEAGDGYYIFVVNSGSLTINAGSFVGGGVIYNGGGSVVLGGGQYESTSSSRLAIRLDDGTVSLKYGCTYQADGKDDLKEITESVDYDGSVVVLPSAVAELMGSTIYEEESLGDEYIYVNDEGYIVNVYGYDDCTNLSTNFRVTIDGDNYVFTDTRYSYTYIFYVEGGKITKIFELGIENVFYPKESVATGIKDVEGAKANKATKALENGRMIIIRNGEKYDLCGSKL